MEADFDFGFGIADLGLFVNVNVNVKESFGLGRSHFWSKVAYLRRVLNAYAGGCLIFDVGF